MRRDRNIIFGAMLICAMLVLGLRLWIAHRIEITWVRPVVCLTPRFRANLALGRVGPNEKDRLVATNAEFDPDGNSQPHLWWHIRGVLIHVGYQSLWSEGSRAALSERLFAHMHDCVGYTFTTTAPTAASPPALRGRPA